MRPRSEFISIVNPNWEKIKLRTNRIVRF